MRRVVRLLVIVTSVVSVLAVGDPAGAGGPIKAGQHFAGLVNGTGNTPVVNTVCAGPSSSSGFVASGQTMSVVRRRNGTGYTGLFAQVYAWFVPSDPSNRPVMLTFTRYGVAQSIPSTIQVPCDGTGQVEFSSCPYLAPCAAGWVPDFVDVHFVNLAV